MGERAAASGVVVSVLLSVDPGVRGCGAAIFFRNLLMAAAYVKNPVKPGPIECVKSVAFTVKGWVTARAVANLNRDEEVSRLVLEFPQTYGGRAARGDANDLFPLAAIDGALAALFPRAEVTSYFPREWKSNIDPDVLIKRIESRLTPEEHARVELPAKSLQHNVFDAIGIGLAFLGRLEPRKVYAR